MVLPCGKKYQFFLIRAIYAALLKAFPHVLCLHSKIPIFYEIKEDISTKNKEYQNTVRNIGLIPSIIGLKLNNQNGNFYHL